MRFITFIFLIQLARSSLYTWTQETNMTGLLPLPRGGHSMAALGRNLYIFGGCDVRMKCFNDLHTYGTDSHEWSRLNSTGDIPSARGGHSFTVLGSTAFLFGGSNKGLSFNDLFIYDAISDSWEMLFPKGDFPSGRSNHAASLDSDGNLLIVGGYSFEGYLNDAWLYSVSSNEWKFLEVSGKPPTPRELASLLVIDDQAYLFGGFHEGGVSSEFYMLDMLTKDWFLVEDDGYLPEGREGHGMLRLGDFIFLIGGCDFGFSVCYDRLYSLDLLTMWWTKLDHEDFTPLPGQKERLGSVSIGSVIYTFGGCYLNSHCFNDLMYLDTGVECSNDCNGHGSCRGGMCICQNGYIGTECEVRTYCKDKCNYRGYCNSDAECECYPGYKGEVCEFRVDCPRNCTSSVHGTCQSNGRCKCNIGYSGPECTCQCVNGFCAGDGKCLCEVGWEGDLCSIPKESSTEETSVYKEYSEEEESETTTSSSETDAENSSDEDAENQETDSDDEEVESSEVNAGWYTQKGLTACKDDCNNRGVCQGTVCYCESGWHGEACEIMIDSNNGISVIAALALCLLFIIVGIVSGACYVGIFYRSGKEPEEYPLIR